MTHKGDAMTEHSTISEHARIRMLESEVLALQQRLDQREEALRQLNRRLLQLEHGENGISGMERAEVSQLIAHIEALEGELESLRSTKLFRWAAPARWAYAQLRGRGV